MTKLCVALEEATVTLRDNLCNPRFEAEVLLAHLLQKNRAYLFAHPEHIIDNKKLSQYHHLIMQRAEGMPIAYLTGHREFWSLDLEVNANTLIPRHETERLVEIALALIPDTDETQVLDLGTGSGAIALALAKEKPHWRIHASDFNQEALHIAAQNAQRLGLTQVTFYHSDWFTSIPFQHYHAIVSNPPYLAADDPHLHLGDLRFEPINALVSGQNGLADLNCIITQSYSRLLANGLLLLEHGWEQKEAIHSIFNRLDYKNIACWQDLQGHDRVSGGWRANTL